MSRRADPRERSDGLGCVTRAVFGGDRTLLWTGRASDLPAPGWRIAARYVIAPSVERARFLLPVAPGAVVASSLLSYNALRPPAVRMARAVAGRMLGWGVIGPARLPTLNVAVAADAAERDELLVEHLTALLGLPRLHAAVGVRPPDPNYKPTLQLFDDAGQPRAYAKVGWNDATRALVQAESDALRRLPRGAPSLPIAPRLLAAGQWSGREIAVVAPLPSHVRRVRGSAGPRCAELLAVARRGGGAGPVQRLDRTNFLARLTQLATDASSQGGDGRRAAAMVAAFRCAFGHVAVEVGDWHGDWVPWNLATGAHGELFAWDWEHSGQDVPVGFDLAHHGFQRALILRKEGVLRAAAAADELLRCHGGALNLRPEHHPLTVSGYLLELWFRAWRLATAGAGWHPALHPGLLRELERRLQQHLK